MPCVYELSHSTVLKLTRFWTLCGNRKSAGTVAYSGVHANALSATTSSVDLPSTAESPPSN